MCYENRFFVPWGKLDSTAPLSAIVMNASCFKKIMNNNRQCKSERVNAMLPRNRYMQRPRREVEQKSRRKEKRQKEKERVRREE